jgi:hypothetical protein
MLKLARSTNSLRLLAIVTLFAMIMPMLVLEKVRAEVAPSTSTAPVSAPPEPFIIGTSEPSPVFLAPYLTAIGDFFSTSKLPEGFEMAKVPTFGDKISSYFGSFLGLFTGLTKSPATEAPAPPPAAPVDFDFDNDGKSDIGRWHATTSEFKVKKSSDGNYLTYTLGSSAAKATPGDFNGDGNTDACVFLAGAWTYKTSTTASAQTVNFGTSGDLPVAGDYDGDGTTDFAVFRPSTGYWWILKSSDSSYYSVSFGTSTDIMTPGDFDGDGYNDLAFFRPSTGDWHIDASTSGYYSAHWGASVDTPVAADYDGDDKTDMAVYRPTTGEWFAYNSKENNGSYRSATWGSWGDQPVPGYYDDDTMADFAVWRPKTGGWYTMNSRTSSYSYHMLGVPGDQAVPSAYIKQVGSTVSGSDLNNARLSPKNATGGTDLYSQNFSWSTGLVGLPGRSGLDMSVGLSYNSLVWTKVGSAMVFDPDTSNVSPGFRFGFPVIEPVFYDDNKDTFSYLMVTPSGGRVEFRQTAVGNTYDTADSSYTQLVTTGASNPNDPVEDITIKVSTTDGTQMSYEWKAGAFRCKEIKDRNGNYITITHNDYGGLATVTDTLGRVITVNYSSGEAPSSITQTWKSDNGGGSTSETQNWARFEYATLEVDTNFVEGSPNHLTVFGPPDGTYIQVLQKIKRSDDSYTTFDYNTWGQVKQINNYAADTHKLNHVAVNLPANAGSSQSDCPRFTETKSYVENFNSGNEITVNNTITASQSYSLPGITSGSGTMIQVWMTGRPDNLRSNTFVGSSGWNEGLPIATEDCLTTSSTCSDRKRWTWTEWTQDDTGLSYPLNPRVIQSRVGDSSNVKKTTIDYRTVSGVVTFGLPETVKIYDSDLSTVLKQIETKYDIDSLSEYTSRRIIGLPSKTEVSGLDGTGFHLVSKVTYKYDEGNFSDSGLYQNISPTQHDNTNYSSSFVTGRGNLTSAMRWDLAHPTSSSYGVTSSMKYNTAGSVVSKTDPMSRVVKIGYTDVWNDGVSRSTYAYPTALTDVAGNVSNIKYRYDFGGNVWGRSPTVDGNSTNSGKRTERTYDDKGRIVKEQLMNFNGPYTRYEYSGNGIQAKSYSTVIDTDGDGADADDEVLSETWFDGAGRVRRSRTAHPNSYGGWVATQIEYDNLGRVKRSTVPTEVSVNTGTNVWTPAGDDDRGYDSGSNPVWLWNRTEYDWKDRPTRIIPPDSTGSDGKDKIFSYEGCGCAGGQVTTVQGENIVETDWAGDNPTI